MISARKVFGHCFEDRFLLEEVSDCNSRSLYRLSLLVLSKGNRNSTFENGKRVLVTPANL